jgi:hypothetical protein
LVTLPKFSASAYSRLGSIALVFLASHVRALPCDTATTTLTEKQATYLGVMLESQLKAKYVTVLSSHRVGDWYLLYVDTLVADPAYLFYSADTLDHRYVAMWSGGAKETEQPELVAWALKNAPGIPEALAKCFGFVAVNRQ